MRLICPNCGAQYKVSDDAIPPAGRDVQCSNCGNTWLELPGASQRAEAGITLDEPIDKAFADVAPNRPATPQREAGDEFESAEGEEGPTAAPVRRAVDPSVTAILQEEAARETAARQMDLATTDIHEAFQQQELALPPDPPQQTETARAVRAMKAEQDVARATKRAAPRDDVAARVTVAETVNKAVSRKALLPDIEEINSSLRSNAERGTPTIQEPEEIIREHRRGFRFGFLSGLLIITALVLLYLFANQISQVIPALSGLLDTYVETVNAGRVWLDTQAQNLLDKLTIPAETAVDTTVNTATGSETAETTPSDAATP